TPTTNYDHHSSVAFSANSSPRTLHATHGIQTKSWAPATTTATTSAAGGGGEPHDTCAHYLTTPSLSGRQVQQQQPDVPRGILGVAGRSFSRAAS
ncbi:unnamed protein product, partial [Pylaiella littoralis]